MPVQWTDKRDKLLLLILAFGDSSQKDSASLQAVLGCSNASLVCRKSYLKQQAKELREELGIEATGGGISAPPTPQKRKARTKSRSAKGSPNKKTAHYDNLKESHHDKPQDSQSDNVEEPHNGNNEMMDEEFIKSEDAYDDLFSQPDGEYMEDTSGFTPPQTPSPRSNTTTTYFAAAQAGAGHYEDDEEC